MSFYDPLYPTISSTRNQIQRSIIALEEKLKQVHQILTQRRQLDNDIEYMIDNELLRRNPHPQPYPPYHQPTPQPQLRYHNYFEDKLASQQLKYVREEEDANYHHFNRMDVLERERLQLSRERYRDLQVQSEARLRHKFVQYDEDDDALIRKYQDGTKVKEYQHQLQTYTHQRPYQSPHRKPINRSLAGEFKIENHKNVSPSSFNKRSPYAKLETSNKKYETSSKDKKPKFFRNPSQFLDKKLQSTTKMQSYRSYRKEPQTSVRVESQPYIQKKTSRKQKSSQKMNKSKTIERSSMYNAQNEALKKIQNRLKLSEIVYEDSKFRNIKHEGSHLHNTFQNEIKARRDIKDKLNNHPSILRKHAMVVE